MSLRERVHLWGEQTHGPFLELLRHFFARQFDTDVVSEPGRLQGLVVGVIAAFAGLTLYLPLTGFRKYVDLTSYGDPDLFYRHALSDRLFYLLIPMWFAGLVTALLWQELFPTGRDHTILMPLPISRGQMFAAKFLALFGLVTLLTASVTVFPSLMVPVIQDSILAPRNVSLWLMALHAFTSFAAAWFAFLFQVSLQGLLMNVLGAHLYPRVSLLAQSVTLLGLLIAGPQIFTLTYSHLRGAIPLDAQLWAPPFWFHAIYELEAGRPTAHLQELARRGWLALAGTAASTLLLYVTAYFRQSSALAETQSRLPFPALESAARWAIGLMHKAPQQLAILSFVFKTLARSRQHKLILSGYLGLGLAVLVNLYIVSSRTDQVDQVHSVLAAPLVLCFFLLSGLRVVFSIPVTLQANWIFQLLEGDQRLVWLGTIETAFYFLALAPQILLVPLLTGPLLGWTAAPGHAAVCVLSAMILAELMLREWRKVPFVCSYLPGQKNIALTVVIYWSAFTLYAFTTSAMELFAMNSIARMSLLIGILLAAYAKLRESRLELWGVFPMTYEEEPEPVVETLGLQPR